MASLDDVTRKIVEGMGYLSLCRADTNNGYDRAQFVKMYERNIERIQAEQVTPSFIKKRLELVQAERLMLE
jgi:hypothetical protein